MEGRGKKEKGNREEEVGGNMTEEERRLNRRGGKMENEAQKRRQCQGSTGRGGNVKKSSEG